MGGIIVIISIQDDLMYLADKLEHEGYEIHSFSENIVSDVYIYSQSINGMNDIYNSITPSEEGSFILNADGMSINEIITSIRSRTYTPLFE